MFTKLLKPVVAYLRKIGIRLVIYLDDVIFFRQDRHLLSKQVKLTISLLEQLGFLINWDISIASLTRLIEFLGLDIDTVNGSISLPSSKVWQITSFCDELLSMNTLKLRHRTHFRKVFLGIDSSGKRPSSLPRDTGVVYSRVC